MQAQEEAGKQLRLIRNELAPVPGTTSIIARRHKVLTVADNADGKPNSGDENNENIYAIAQEACAGDLFPILAICLPKLDFEVPFMPS